MEVKPGTRLRSAVCATQVIAVKAPTGALDLRCGGHPVLRLDAPRPDGLAVDAGFDRGTLLSKCYTDASGELELLCTKAGPSSLSVGDTPLEIRDAKPLPSSD